MLWAVNLPVDPAEQLLPGPIEALSPSSARATVLGSIPNVILCAGSTIPHVPTVTRWPTSSAVPHILQIWSGPGVYVGSTSPGSIIPGEYHAIRQSTTSANRFRFPSSQTFVPAVAVHLHLPLYHLISSRGPEVNPSPLSNNNNFAVNTLSCIVLFVGNRELLWFMFLLFG